MIRIAYATASVMSLFSIRRLASAEERISAVAQSPWQERLLPKFIPSPLLLAEKRAKSEAFFRFSERDCGKSRPKFCKLSDISELIMRE